MKAIFFIKSMQKSCRITNKWIILIAIIVSICFSSCVPPRNMETGEIMRQDYQKSQTFSGGLVHSNSKARKNSKIKSDKLENENDPITAFEKKVLKNNDNKNLKTNITDEPKNSNNKLLPSLKEQIDEISQNQSEIENTIGDIKEDVNEMRKLLNNIHNTKGQTDLSYDSSNDYKIKAGKNPNEEVKTGTFIMDSDENDDNSDITNNTLISDEASNIDKKKNKVQKADKDKIESIQPTVSKNSLYKPKVEKKVQNQLVNTVKKESKEDVEQKSILEEKKEIHKNIGEQDFSEIIHQVAKGDFVSAIKIISLKLKSTKNPMVVSDCQYWLGECNFNQKKYNEAIENYKSVLLGKSDKKDIAQAKLAESYMKIGKNEEARNEFQSLLKNYPKSMQTPKAKKMLQQL